ncbi:MAG: hypothetical protein ABFS12_06555 [Bacteroidota bacterium]
MIYKLLFYLTILFTFPLLISILSSCQSVQTQSGVRSQYSNIDAEQEEVRLRLNEYAIRFSGEVATAADEIKNNSNDLQIKQNVLLWKMNSIPAAYKVLFTIDPYAAGIDMWAFTRQMHLFFESGNGKDLFGDQQIVAIETSKNLENEIYDIIKITVADTSKIMARDTIYKFAEENPFTNLTFTRHSTIDFLAKHMADHDRTIATSVGNMETAISDLSMRLNIYYDQLPKIASWNVEYLTNKAMMSDDVDSLRLSIAAITNSLEQLAAESERIEQIINSGVVKSSEELDQLREKLLLDIKLEREAIFASLANEREIILTEIDRERLETITRLEEILNSTVNQASFKIEDTIDYILIRVIVLLIIGYLIFVITNRVFKQRKQN